MASDARELELGTVLQSTSTPDPVASGSVEPRSALLDEDRAPFDPGQAEGGDAGAGGTQLPLPLDLEMEPRPDEPRPLARGRRSRSKGFVPVTRDPDVARSYSDNAALDQAIARGLAQALSGLPPEELAALKAKLARAPRAGRRQPARDLP